MDSNAKLCHAPVNKFDNTIHLHTIIVVTAGGSPAPPLFAVSVVTNNEHCDVTAAQKAAAGRREVSPAPNSREINEACFMQMRYEQLPYI